MSKNRGNLEFFSFDRLGTSENALPLDPQPTPEHACKATGHSDLVPERRLLFESVDFFFALGAAKECAKPEIRDLLQNFVPAPCDRDAIVVC